MILYSLFYKFRRIIYKLRNTFYYNKNTKMKCTYGLNTEKRNLPRIVVSLTTFPNRLEKIDLCIKSILNQNFKPDRIIIWLGSDCPKDIAEKYLSKYKKYGLEYYIDKKNNYYSHKKYIYSFSLFPNSIIITLDDDLIYSKNLIKILINKYRKYPNCIISRRVHKMMWSGEEIKPYSRWLKEYPFLKKPSNNLFLTTGAGVLFPPHILPKEVCNYNLISKYAKTADDVWINMIAAKNKIRIVYAGNFLQMPLEISSTQNSGLWKINVENNKNDEYIKNLIRKFELTKSNFLKNKAGRSNKKEL